MCFFISFPQYEQRGVCVGALPDFFFFFSCPCSADHKQAGLATENWGGRGLRGGPGKRVDGVFPGRPQSFRHQSRPVNNCSPGRGEMAQNGGTRGGTFHGEMDCCRGSQGWTKACSHMPERDGKDQGEKSSKQAGPCWFARPC